MVFSFYYIHVFMMYVVFLLGFLLLFFPSFSWLHGVFADRFTLDKYVCIIIISISISISIIIGIIIITSIILLVVLLVILLRA